MISIFNDFSLIILMADIWYSNCVKETNNKKKIHIIFFLLLFCLVWCENLLIILFLYLNLWNIFVFMDLLPPYFFIIVKSWLFIHGSVSMMRSQSKHWFWCRIVVYNKKLTKARLKLCLKMLLLKMNGLKVSHICMLLKMLETKQMTYWAFT